MPTIKLYIGSAIQASVIAPSDVITIDSSTVTIDSTETTIDET